MSNLNLQKLHEWVWPWPWIFMMLLLCIIAEFHGLMCYSLDSICSLMTFHGISPRITNVTPCRWCRDRNVKTWNEAAKVWYCVFLCFIYIGWFDTSLLLVDIRLLRFILCPESYVQTFLRSGSNKYRKQPTCFRLLLGFRVRVMVWFSVLKTN